ncbi:hypothetical protein Nepgr_013548 [Nepenthes gracilis]|uniref:Uncharacterized protein n=1 Tax=Nepenthes gracilis TaxID=150966 RepID=A0AAD3SII8_NEPGR|nr:hypothetical protein Nepgr_013548 [Nepenthes gracilis]
MLQLLCGIVKVLVFLMPRFLSSADYGMAAGLLWCIGSFAGCLQMVSSADLGENAEAGSGCIGVSSKKGGPPKVMRKKGPQYKPSGRITSKMPVDNDQGEKSPRNSKSKSVLLMKEAGAAQAELSSLLGDESADPDCLPLPDKDVEPLGESPLGIESDGIEGGSKSQGPSSCEPPLRKADSLAEVPPGPSSSSIFVALDVLARLGGCWLIRPSTL